MARKKSPDTIIDKGVKAALSLAEETPWAALNLKDIAEEAGLTLSDFHGVADKGDLADAVEPFFDKVMSAEAIDAEEAPRTRLFEAIMLRFEAMEDHRAGLLSLMKHRDASPARLLSLLPARQASAEWALICAGLDGSQDAPLSLKAVNVAWAMARAERAWRKEDSPDFTRTMAALDKELREAEDRGGVWRRMRGRRKSGGDGWRYADENDPTPEKSDA